MDKILGETYPHIRQRLITVPASEHGFCLSCNLVNVGNNSCEDNTESLHFVLIHVHSHLLEDVFYFHTFCDTKC